MGAKDRTHEAIQGFLSDFPSVNAAKGNLVALSYAAVKRSKNGKAPLWYYASISSFRNPVTGKHGRWYDDVLLGLVLGAGWFESIEEARAFIADIRLESDAAKARKSSESKLSMTRQETIDTFKHMFPSSELVEEELVQLSSTAVSKKNEKFMYGAKAHFKDVESNSTAWYDTVLPRLMLAAGWFNSLEEAAQFAENIKSACRAHHGRKVSARRLSMTFEEVITAFKLDFPSLEDAKKDPVRLSEKTLKKELKKREKHWFYPAYSIFAKEKKSWYHALARLMLEVEWFDTLEAAEKFANEVSEARRAAGGKRIASARSNMTEEEAIAAFQDEFPSLEEARKDIRRLGEMAVKEIQRKSGCSWVTTSFSLYKKPDGKMGRWYDHALPNLMLKSGWFETIEEAFNFSMQVKAEVLKGRALRQSRDRIKMSEADILAAFNRDFPSLEEARKDLSAIGLLTIRQIAEGSRGHWYYPARSLFGTPGEGKRANWYEDILPNLALRAKWFETIEEGVAFSKEVKKYCRALRIKRQIQTKLKMSESKIIELFKGKFQSLEAVKKDLTLLGCSRIKEMAESNKGHWYFPALSLFRNPNTGKRGRWYEDVLPNLVLKAGWFVVLAEAHDFSKEVERAVKKASKEKGIATQGSMTEHEVIEAFRRDFPCIEEARGDLTKLSKNAISTKVKGKSGHWYTRSLSLYRNPDTGRLGRWYVDILPNLVFKAGWFATMEEAAGFANEVETACKTATARKISRARRSRDNSPKNTRKYAVVVESFKRETHEGSSFDGISKLLNIDSIASDQNNQNGIARAVIASQPIKSSLSPAEILRFKMSTGNWSGEMAEAYAQVFSFIAPYLTTRLLMLHVFKLFKEEKIQNLGNGASFLSGPGEVYHALQDLKNELNNQGIAIPLVLDIDAEKDMLDKSGNPNKLLATLPNSSLASESMDFVECSSLYQFNQRKEPNIVKDIILEAKRVLKENGALILTSTAKRFGPEFEKALQSLGFDIITSANTRLKISEEARNRIEENMGAEVLRKANEAARDTYFLVAVKTNRSSEDASAEWLRFEKPKTELPEEAQSIAKQARSFSRKLDDSEATENIERMANILENLSPDTHLNHAELIQSVLSKYMLEARIKRPGPDEKTLRENASRILNDLDAMNLCAEKDMYFVTLRRMAKAHTSKLKAANPNQKIKQK